MDDSCGHIMVTDMCIGVRDLFVELVSGIDHGSHKTIKIVMVRKLHIFIGVPGMEFGNGTFRLILHFQSAVQFEAWLQVCGKTACLILSLRASQILW